MAAGTKRKRDKTKAAAKVAAMRESHSHESPTAGDAERVHPSSPSMFNPEDVATGLCNDAWFRSFLFAASAAQVKDGPPFSRANTSRR